MPLIISLISLAFIVLGIILLIFGNNRKTDDYDKKQMIIGGWAVIIVSAIALVISLIIYANQSELGVASFLLTTAAPLTLPFGFAIAIALSITNLVKGYRVDANGKRNTTKIITGWALLILAVVIVLAVVISISVVFDQYSNSDANEIRFM